MNNAPYEIWKRNTPTEESRVGPYYYMCFFFYLTGLLQNNDKQNHVNYKMLLYTCVKVIYLHART